jgi:hypothetical protein
MTWFIHVNKNTIASNRKKGTEEPAIRFQNGKYGKPIYANRVRFKEGEFIYAPHGDPLLPCGARMVLATEFEPEVVA